ncbi:MAG: hypothetical protein GY832_00215 [Chloroflexi bacterium]|nr:hypothetical protein [Chloroflexota bacterium]
MRKFSIQLICVLVLVTSLSGCGGGQSTGVPPAVEMLPDLPDHYVVEGEVLTDHITNLSEGAALLAAQPELAVAVLVVDQIVSCYQDIGAAQVQLYAKEEMPLSAGAVAIADRNALTDPVNLFKCVVPVVLDTGQADAPQLEIQPCSASYTLSQDGNEFYIVYAGTTEEICHAFCEQLEGCTAH